VPKERRLLIARTLPELAAMTHSLRAEGLRLGFAPTMGALHAGHLALIAAGQSEGMAMVASIFVNPTQFGPAEDFSRYPRTEASDLAMLETAGCRLAWLPTVETMYPPGAAVSLRIGGSAGKFEGAVRPGHFDGMATVVTILLGQVRPDIAYFGEKDWQQLQIVRQVVTELGLPYVIRGVPTVREGDGLALSSRNRFLTGEERAIAPRLYRCLQDCAQLLRDGKAVNEVLAAGKTSLQSSGFATDYLALVDGSTLHELGRSGPGAHLITAARLGTVRLLDNLAVA
jgi:pantoate--beta-alanine ligase